MERAAPGVRGGLPQPGLGPARHQGHHQLTGSSRPPEAPSDREQIALLLRAFFAAFTSGPDVVARLDGLRALLLPSAVIVKTCGGEPTVYDVDAFIAPRQALLTTGVLQDFHEWEVEGQTQVFGDIAQHFCTYAKAWVQDGVPVAVRGMKTIQLVRTGDGWRISEVAWDDEREGLVPSVHAQG